ncbi:hypothetical protein ACFSCX_02050 [Bacillus salitolerans]|uniref:UPF0738 protein ACFSCX_02050 n=1 Tax=Bacillus salitolerans TaxID=1437434 RepID=A0ABW4LJQ5_9BACI
MSNKIKINHIEWKSDQLLMYSDDKSGTQKSLTATGRVLADSDDLAFIYILETEQEYVYISIPSDYWIDLKKVMEGNHEVILHIHNETIILEGILEELQYLISNIEGNSNYGTEMVDKVEQIFLAPKNV